MRTLREALADARTGGYAIPHFNVTDLAQLRAVARVARELGTAILVGTSEGERDYIGVARAVALVRSLREEGVPLYLNADHTHSVERIEEAARAGYDAVLFDGGALPFEENVLMTSAAVQVARSVDPGIVVEGEMGYIGNGSGLLDAIPAGAALSPDALTAPERAREFVAATGVDLFAPAVGNIHGMLKGMENPRLDIPRLKEIAETSGASLVLHGGSGIPEEDLVAAVQNGIDVAHVSTELRLAWRNGVAAGLARLPDEVNPAKLMADAEEGVYQVALARARLFLRR
jgi:fructose-bisphosphate aldolase class II